MINKIVLYSIMIVMLVSLAYAEPRRSVSVYDNGEHVLVPNVGECDPGGCVVSEHYTKQRNGVKWLHQRIDVDSDGVCDILRVWKPLEDPTHGLYYTIYSSKPCGGAI